MAWEKADVLAAYNAISPAPASDQAAADTLNAQTVTVTVNVPATSVRDYLLTTGEWGALMVQIQPGTTATATIQGIIHMLKTLVDTNAIVQATVPQVQASVSGWLSQLQSAGLLAASTVTALEAMWSVTGPKWVPTISAADIASITGK